MRNRARPPAFGNGALPAIVNLAIAAGALLVAPLWTPAAADAPTLTPDRWRITDQAIARDLATIDAVGKRIAAFDTVQAPERVYTRAQAAAWLALAREQYRLNDRSGLVDAAFARASELAGRLEAGEASLDSLPRELAGTIRLRLDLRTLADSLKHIDALRCLAEPLARFELELVRSGHEAVVCRRQDPHPHAENLDRGAAELRSLAAACATPIAVGPPPPPEPISAAAPPALPEPTMAPAPLTSQATLKRLAALNNVHFDLNAETISTASAAVLDSVAAVLREAPEIRVALVGHTDPRGSPAYNMRLGRRRATAVRDYLVRAGVATERLSVVSFGKAVLMAHGTGLRDNALNRRVEIQYSAPDGMVLESRRQEGDLQIERAGARPPAAGVRRTPGSGAHRPIGSVVKKTAVSKPAPASGARKSTLAKRRQQDKQRGAMSKGGN